MTLTQLMIAFEVLVGCLLVVLIAICERKRERRLHPQRGLEVQLIPKSKPLNKGECD